ncbi:MAG: glutamate synthase subunit alpha [Spirochaetales bacterium]|jgi:glutamate synthase (NADPH/NADH) large chain|nr:glutamate synthase subunit alpha [Spirochaetales bacterium]
MGQKDGGCHQPGREQEESEQGLHRRAWEHDSCGIGFVADIKARPSHSIVARGLEILERLTHRGAESADNLTGDGSGITLQIPHRYYSALIPRLPPAGLYGTGLLFLPGPRSGGPFPEHELILALLKETAGAFGLKLLGLRDVPVNPAVIGPLAAETEPVIKQVFLTSPENRENLELKLFLFRKRFERRLSEAARDQGIPRLKEAYFPSLSSKTMVYKGMFMPQGLAEYYPELKEESLASAVALVHSRFSTNTFPSWALAQPFRLAAHNGEINSITGNRSWIRAREALLAHPRFGGAFDDFLPVLQSGASDSANFDNVLELLTAAGRSLPHALMMLIPESWNDRNPIPPELQSFYEYHACLMEPWDGPAAMIFFDGRYVGGILDRNGLRPARYGVTREGLLIMASETGVQDLRPEEVEFKGRLLPGKILLLDLEEGRIIPDEEVKREVCSRQDYQGWVNKNLLTLSRGTEKEEFDRDIPELQVPGVLDFMEMAAGYSREDLDKLLLPSSESTEEPSGSMGTDTPLAVFSDRPQRVFAYFKQLFAQVTNPPIDSIREDLVMTLTSFVGPQENLLEEGEAHCRRIKVFNPILSSGELERLKKLNPRFTFQVLDATFYVPLVDNRRDLPGRVSPLEAALDRLVEEAVQGVAQGAGFLILSDRAALDPLSGRCLIPSLLALGAVHHGLIERGLRTRTSLIVESCEPREVMHFALLFGYGADLIQPYGALGVIRRLHRERPQIPAPAPEPRGEEVSGGFSSLSAALLGELGEAPSRRSAGDYHPVERYLKGLHKAMLKIMSKMGTSTLRSYRGAQLFTALGLGPEVVAKCFRNTSSPLGGIGFAELQAEAETVFRQARRANQAAPPGKKSGDSPSLSRLLPEEGQYRWRREGEVHAWNPETIYKLQWAARTGDYEKFKEFTAAADALNRNPHVIRGLLDFAPAQAIPLAEVESEEAILKRFTSGAMSFGSISKEAHETIAQAMNSLGLRSNSGEGGENAQRYASQEGVCLNSAIKQVASARFGVTSEYLASAREIQIKIAQGAKPGEGGQLPGHKVDALIARTRHSTSGVTLISPPPHHDIYSIEDLAELIFDLKNANPLARIGVKLVSESGVGTIAAGVAKAHADSILISGYDGGTGASPQSSIRHAGLPWELGLAETQQVLLNNGLRGRVRLMTDGQLKTGRDLVIAGCLGAEEFGFGTAVLVVLGCVMMRKCHANTCPMGVATQDPELRARFSGRSEYLIHFFRFLARQTREIMAGLGVRRFDDLVGRTEYLVPGVSSKAKAGKLDLGPLLYVPSSPGCLPGGDARRCVQGFEPGEGRPSPQAAGSLDRQLIEQGLSALDKKIPASLRLEIKNTHRAVGAGLSYEVSRRLGSRGLPENFITVDFTGSAGQSFGAFLARGITFRLAGDANDYLGKGLSGGRIIIAPPEGSAYQTEKNIIVGNTVLYGATSGELFAAGVSGERFCVRNSGALAVVEGVGDHGAEYMTGGRLVVLGDVGRNFAAGMSGGIAYVLDREERFQYFVNPGMVELLPLDEEDENFVRDCINSHVYWTGSSYGREILQNFDNLKNRFIKVLPVEYKWALEKIKLEELNQRLFAIREQEALAQRS